MQLTVSSSRPIGKNCGSVRSGGEDVEGIWHLIDRTGCPHFRISVGASGFCARVTPESAGEAVVLSRMIMVEGVQSVWTLLLHCADGRSNCKSRFCQVRDDPEICRRSHKRIAVMFTRHIDIIIDVGSTVRDIVSMSLRLEACPSKRPADEVRRYTRPAGRIVWLWSGHDTQM